MTDQISPSEIQGVANSAPTLDGYVCCARIYVQPVKNLRTNNKVVKIMGEAGFRYMTRPGGYKAFYIGYDNATGIEAGVGKAIADYLNENGVTCYMDADMD